MVSVQKSEGTDVSFKKIPLAAVSYAIDGSVARVQIRTLNSRLLQRSRQEIIVAWTRMANGGRKNGQILNVYWFEGGAVSTCWAVREGASAQRFVLGES